MPKNNRFSPRIAKVRLVNFGSNILSTDYKQIGTQGIDLRKMIDVGSGYPIRIRIEQGKMLVSADIKDAEGRMIAQVIDNKWKINPNNSYDRNFDNNAFEVIDKQKMPALQIAITQENMIYIGGIFNLPTGKATVTPNGYLWNPSDDQIPESIQRIFVYPGDKNLGKRAP